MNEIKVNNIYRHFKGKYYYVKELVSDSETLETYVVYQALYGEHKVWVRKLSSFNEEVEQDRIDNITKQRSRFEIVEIDKEKL